MPVQQCCQLRFSKYLSIGDLTCCQFFLSLDNFSLLILVLFFFLLLKISRYFFFFRLRNKLVDLLDMLNKNIQSFLVYCPILKPINVRWVLIFHSRNVQTEKQTDPEEVLTSIPVEWEYREKGNYSFLLREEKKSFAKWERWDELLLSTFSTGKSTWLYIPRVFIRCPVLFLKM